MIGREYKMPMFAVVCLGFIGYQLYSAAEFVGSHDWVQTSATVQAKYRGRPRGQSASIRYQYIYNGQKYSGNRVRFGMWTSNADLSEYREGESTTVWVDPDQPSSSSLKLEYSQIGIVLFGVSVSVFLGIVGMMIAPLF